MESKQQIEAELNKFTDSLVLSSSANCNEIQIWEPKSLAPYDSLIDREKKTQFGAICAHNEKFVFASHPTKGVLTTWKWTKRENEIKSPMKENISHLRISADGLYLFGAAQVSGSG